METPPTKSPRETLDSLGALVDTIQYLSQYGSFVGASDLYLEDAYNAVRKAYHAQRKQILKAWHGTRAPHGPQ